MRTVDLIVVGPAAVAAVGIGDVIGRIVRQVPLGLATIAPVTDDVAMTRNASVFSMRGPR